MTKIHFEYPKYLTEKRLEDVLRAVWPKASITKQFSFDEAKRLKYDYCVIDSEQGLRSLVEFDGDSHYRQAAVQSRDKRKEILAEKHGFVLIRWPYWIQPSVETLKHFLNISSNAVSSDYQNGFHDKKCVLPADFNGTGVLRFIEELRKLPIGIRQEVFISLGDKILDLSEDLVLGPNELLADLSFACDIVATCPALPLLDWTCIKDDGCECCHTESAVMDGVMTAFRELVDEGDFDKCTVTDALDMLSLKDSPRVREFVDSRFRGAWKAVDTARETFERLDKKP